jgi:hypothetical protein
MLPPNNNPYDEYEKWGLPIIVEKTKYLHTGEGVTPTDTKNGDEIHICKNICT